MINRGGDRGDWCLMEGYCSFVRGGELQGTVGAKTKLWRLQLIVRTACGYLEGFNPPTRRVPSKEIGVALDHNAYLHAGNANWSHSGRWTCRAVAPMWAVPCFDP